MTQTFLDQVLAVDSALLAEVVRQDQRSPAYQILEWSARPLSGKGLRNPEGLLLLEGRGSDGRGETGWRIVVKSVQTEPNPAPPDNLWYWKRELEFFRSGLLDQLPGKMPTPRCYLAEDTPWGFWIWLEYVQDESPERWGLDLFAFAAREIGRWNGCCFQQGFLPEYPWLCRDARRDWMAFAENFPGWRDRSSPMLRKWLSEEDYARAMRVWDESEAWLALIHRLPQVFSHFDFQRRNILLRIKNQGQNDLFVIDWSNVGYGPLGAEVTSLVGINALLFEYELDDLARQDGVVLDGYLAGLRDEGWSGDPDVVRLGQAAWFALFAGATGPASVALMDIEDRQKWGQQSFNCEPDGIAEGWAQLCRYGLDRADEARVLASRLGFAL